MLVPKESVVALSAPPTLALIIISRPEIPYSLPPRALFDTYSSLNLNPLSDIVTSISEIERRAEEMSFEQAEEVILIRVGEKRVVRRENDREDGKVCWSENGSTKKGGNADSLGDDD